MNSDLGTMFGLTRVAEPDPIPDPTPEPPDEPDNTATEAASSPGAEAPPKAAAKPAAKAARASARPAVKASAEPAKAAASTTRGTARASAKTTAKARSAPASAQAGEPPTGSNGQPASISALDTTASALSIPTESSEQDPASSPRARRATAPAEVTPTTPTRPAATPRAAGGGGVDLEPAAAVKPVRGRAQIMMYAPERLYELFRSQATREGLSYAQLALLCVDAAYDSLGKVFQDRAGASSRFFSTAAYSPRSREKTQKVPINLHLLTRDLAIIDDLWPSLEGCRSRNDFLITAVQHHLEQLEDAPPTTSETDIGR